MSMFRAKKFDLGCFTNIKIIRDHSKRKAFAAAEPERYRFNTVCPLADAHRIAADKVNSLSPRQTSAALHHPQHDAPRPHARHRPAAADPDALLHAPDPDPEPVYSRREGAGYLQRFQDVKGTYG
jgi:hypothetical protein